jgi:hypothetical protein
MKRVLVEFSATIGIELALPDNGIKVVLSSSGWLWFTASCTQ